MLFRVDDNMKYSLSMLFLSQLIYAVLCHFYFFFFLSILFSLFVLLSFWLAPEEIKHMTDNVLLVICTSEIKVMKETYFPEINDMYQRIAAKLQQVNCLCNFFRIICPCMIICNFPTLSFCINLFSSSALPVTVSSALITYPSPQPPHNHASTQKNWNRNIFFPNVLLQRIDAIFNSRVC